MHTKKFWALVFIWFFAGVFFGFAADENVAAAVFGQMRARTIGPAAMSGRITDIDGAAGNPKIIYVGTASGGVWKSVNAGTTFSPVMDAQAMSIGCLAVDQSRPDTVWVGTGECSVRNSVSVGTGLYRTRDGGRNWDLMGFADSERIARVVIHPKNSDTVYVAVLGHLWNDHTERGVYKTTDGGKTWQRMLYVNTRTGCADLAMDAMQPDTLYAAMWEFRRQPWFFNSGGPGSAFYKTTNGGKTWKKLSGGLPTGILGRIGVAVAPSRPETVYALVEAKESAFYRSSDRGESWHKVNGSLAVRQRPFYYSTIEADAKNPEKIFVAGMYFSISEDGGRNFSSPIFSGRVSVHSDIHTFWIDPLDSRHVLVGTDGGVYASEDGARTFRFLGGLPVSQFYHVACDMRHPYWVYGGLQDNGSWIGPSATPAGFIQNKDWQNVGSGDGFYVYPHPQDPDTLYYSWQGGKLVRVNRRTVEAKDIKPLPLKGEPRYRFNWNAAVCLGHFHPDAIYLGGQFLFRSKDRGDSWERISPDLTSNDPKKQEQYRSGGLTIDNTSAENHCTIVAISESPLSPDLIWVGTDDGNLQLTRDGGKTWENVVKNIPGLPPFTWCSGVEASRHGAGTAYAVFDGHRTGDMKPYVYKTGDFGKTWTALASPVIRGYCHVIREDLQNPDLIFLGTEYGLYATCDGGKTWATCKETVPPVAVTDMVIQPRENDLVIATHGRGIYIVDDLTPFRAMTFALLDSEVAVLPSRPTLIRVPYLTQEFPGDDQFTGPNPPSGAFISYYLKKRHIFGELKLDILDAAGKVIKTLPTSKGAGVNRVFWNMRYSAPKTASAPGLPTMILEGPMVPEGVYTVRLTKESQSYTGAIELRNDPELPHSAADRSLRYTTIMKLYRLQEEFAYIGDSLKSMLDQARQLVKKYEGDKKEKRLLATLAAFCRKTEKMHQSLIQQEEIFGEEKLRERIMGLYSSVMRYGGRPTQSQLEHAAVLEDEMLAAVKWFDALVKTDLAQLNRELQSRKIDPLILMTREEYSKKE